MNNLSNVFDYGDDSVTLMVIKTMYCTLQNALARRRVIGDEEADIYLAKHVGATDLLRVIGNEESDRVGYNLHATRVDHDLGALALK